MAYKNKDHYSTYEKVEDHISQRVKKSRKTGEVLKRYENYTVMANGEVLYRIKSIEEARRKKHRLLNPLSENFEEYQKERRKQEEEDAKKYIGKKFNKLTILDIFREFEEDRNILKARCKCDCGNTKDIYLSLVINGTLMSCGCERSNRGAEMMDKYIQAGSRITNYKYKPRTKSGVKGVYKTPAGTYRANLWYKGKKIHLGTYPTLELAVLARREAEEEYFKPEIIEFNKRMDREGTPEFKVDIDEYFNNLGFITKGDTDDRQ